MNKTLKNLITAFTVLCLIVFVVFCIQLLVINRDNRPERDPVLSDVGTGTPSETESPPTDNVLTFDDPNGDDDWLTNDYPENNDDGFLLQTPTIPPPPNTERHAFPLEMGVAELVFYVDMELFEFTNLGDGWHFSNLTGGYSGLEITFVFVHPQGGVNAVADGFLHNYLDGADSVVMGERSIGSSQVRGIFVTGENDGETYSAWLRSHSDFGNDSLALVIVINYRNDAQRDLIYDILDTMHINMLITDDGGDDGDDD